MSLQIHLQNYIQQHELLLPQQRVVVGISGGVDSVVLAHILKSCGYDVFAVHVNYQLRGAESDADEQFVTNFCAENGIALHLAHCDTITEAEKRKESVQETARHLRYDIFERFAFSVKASVVAVAHHADDQAETVLHNLFRGTGIEGLAGMPLKRALSYGSPIQLVRPLLFAKRAEIVQYAHENGLTWREDASNLDNKYKRSAIRNEILPLIQQHFGSHTPNHIVQTATWIQTLVSDELKPTLSEYWQRLTQTSFETESYETESYDVEISALQTLSAFWQDRLLLELCRRMGGTTDQMQGLKSLLVAQTGAKMIFPKYEIWKDRNVLRVQKCALFEPHNTHNTSYQLALGEKVALSNGILSLNIFDGTPDFASKSAQEEFLPLSRLTLPLTVRQWQHGDVMQPLGMNGQTKKVSDLLTDLKIPTHQRQQQWVVISENEVVYLVGFRLDERFKLSINNNDSESIVRLYFSSKSA